MAAREMGMAFTTVQRAMEKLESLSVVSEVSGGKRGRVYCAKALMEILEEPAKLAP
jgi:molybdenum-dependent DNA-binding transcriptional regulator ModE